MLTWAALHEQLVARFTVITRDPSWCGIVLDGQRVAVRPTSRPELYLVVAAVCPQERLLPEEALVYNAAAEHGALALEQSVYALRQVVSIERGVEPVAAAVEAMAAEAVRLRCLAVADPVAPEVREELFQFLAS
jgi:hypothetical protein